MRKLELIQIGDSVGVILPEDMLARLKLSEGDLVRLTESANGVTLSPYPTSPDEQLKVGREFMCEYRNTFHQLDK